MVSIPNTLLILEGMLSYAIQLQLDTLVVRQNYIIRNNCKFLAKLLANRTYQCTFIGIKRVVLCRRSTPSKSVE